MFHSYSELRSPPPPPSLGQWNHINCTNLKSIALYILIRFSDDNDDVIVVCYSYSRWVRLREFKSVKSDCEWRCHTTDFFIFRIKIGAQSNTFFSLRMFLSLLICTWSIREKTYSIALIYFQGCKCKGAVIFLW